MDELVLVRNVGVVEFEALKLGHARSGSSNSIIFVIRNELQLNSER